MRNIYNSIICLAYGIFVVIQVSYNSYFITNGAKIVFHALPYLGMLVLLGLIVLNIPFFLTNRRSVALFIVMALLFLLTYRHTGYDQILYIYLVPFIVPAVGGERLLLTDFKVRTIVTYLIIILSPVLGTVNIFNASTDRWRYSLGFYNPNSVSTMLLMIAMEAIVLRKLLPQWLAWSVNIVSFILMVAFTQSRTSLLIYVAFLGLQMLFEHEDRIFGKIKWILAVFPLLLLAFSYFVTYKYMHQPTGIYALLNSLLSNRLYLGSYFMERYSVNLWGQQLNFHHNGVEVGTLDNGYLNTLLRKGLIPTVAITVIIGWALYKLCKPKYRKYLAPILCLVLVGVTENIPFRFGYNAFLILLAVLVNNKLREVEAK